MMFRRIAVAVSLVSLAASLAGCGSKSNDGGGAGDVDAGDASLGSQTAAFSAVTCGVILDGGVKAADGVSELCSCAVETASDAGAKTLASYSGSPCGEAVLPIVTCCADDDYPGSGSCNCAAKSGGEWKCSGTIGSECTCTFGNAQTPTIPTCTADYVSEGPPSDGGAPQCYQMAIGDRCYCGYQKLNASDTPVSTCDPTSNGGSICAQTNAECGCQKEECYTNNGLCYCEALDAVLMGVHGACNIPSQKCCLDPSNGVCNCSATTSSCTIFGAQYVSVTDCQASTIYPYLTKTPTTSGTIENTCTGVGGTGYPSGCCSSPSGCTCGHGTACPAGSMQVSECTTPAAAMVADGRTACPAGQHALGYCSIGLTPPPPTTTTTTTPTKDAGTTTTGGGCVPEQCVDGTGCYCDGPLNSPSSKCVCPEP